MALLSGRNVQVLLQPSRCIPSSSAVRGLAARSRAPLLLRAAAVESKAAAAPATPPATSSFAGQPAADYIQADNELLVSKISFGAILTPLGIFLLTYGFGAFFSLLPGQDVAALMLIYGFPISVLGFALSYAQLNPVPCKTSKAALELRASQMTDIQQQVREDTTRYRYGDEQHLEEALGKIFKVGRSGGLARKDFPVLVGLREEVVDGAYTLVLEFSSNLDQGRWNEFAPKIQTFFGPGIIARPEVQASLKNRTDVLLISDGTGAGRGGAERKDPLMPLYPGFPARKQ